MTFLDDPFRDGARQFTTLPQTVDPVSLRDHLAQLPGVKLGLFVHSVTESWIDFALEGHAFSVNDQFGEYEFFVANTDAPDELLERVSSHAEMLLGDLTEGRNEMDRRSLAFAYGMHTAILGMLILWNAHVRGSMLAAAGIGLFGGAWWLASIVLRRRASKSDPKRQRVEKQGRTSHRAS